MRTILRPVETLLIQAGRAQGITIRELADYFKVSERTIKQHNKKDVRTFFYRKETKREYQ